MLSYWKAPKGPVERVYLQLGANQRIYGQRVVGDRVAWRGDDMDPEEAERTARRTIGGLPSWTELKRLAEGGEPDHASPQAASARPSLPARPQRPEQRRSPRPSAAAVDAPYTRADTQRLDVYSVAPLPAPTRLTIDPQEPREIANILSRVHNLEVQIAPIDVGRYLVEGCLAIDRISTQDLHREIIDDPRTVLARVAGLSECGHAALFVVEGGLRSHRRAALEQIDGALAYVSVVHGVPVVETIDVWETVYIVLRAVRYACHGEDDGLPMPSHRRGGRKDHRVSPRYVLEGIPGVSTVRASAILDRFSTLQGVASASLDELLAVPHLGPTVAQAVYDAFRME